MEENRTNETELMNVEEQEEVKEGFFTKAKNRVKEFGNSKAGKIVKVAGLVGAGFVAGLAVVKGGSKNSETDGDIEFDFDESDFVDVESTEV